MKAPMIAAAWRPWNSPYAEDESDHPTAEQQEIEFCLACPLRQSDCDACSGFGRLAVIGRPPAEIDPDRLLEMLRLKKRNAEICAVFGVSESTILRAKKKLRTEMTTL